MTKRKLSLVVAIALVALSFSFKASAQEVYLGYSPYEWSTFYQTGFYLTLHDNDTHEEYLFETRSNRMIDSSTYDLGDVPPGNYTVSVRLKTYYSGTVMNLGWYAYGKTWPQYINLYSDEDTVLTTDLTLVNYMDNLEVRFQY